MRIHIELVGFLGDSGLPNGFRGGELEVADGTQLEELMRLLKVLDMIPLLPTVNGRRADLSLVLEDNDIIQLVPPKECSFGVPLWRRYVETIWNLARRNGILVGLLALVLGVPIIFSPYTRSNVFLIKTVFLQSLVFALFLS